MCPPPHVSTTWYCGVCKPDSQCSSNIATNIFLNSTTVLSNAQKYSFSFGVWLILPSKSATIALHRACTLVVCTFFSYSVILTMEAATYGNTLSNGRYHIQFSISRSSVFVTIPSHQFAAAFLKSPCAFLATLYRIWYRWAVVCALRVPILLF